MNTVKKEKTMAKDYKKDYKDLYLPKTKPMMVDIPEMQYVAVEGKGDPNDKKGRVMCSMYAHRVI
jgi:hypothetical protein